MRLSAIADSLWGPNAKTSYLLFASILLLFTFLGGHEIWTQEHRWADIVSGMMYRNDYLHPYLGMTAYYDKPLLSYWLIVLFAKLSQELTVWSLRLPSALAALLAVWSIYRLGCKLQNKQLGLLSGWLLLTTYYFVFWARTSSADMLNMAGSLFAITWYFEKRNQSNFFNYAVFFSILALTSLCKGLIGAIIPLIAVCVDMLIQKSFKQHLRPSLFLAVIPAIIIYLIPFLASAYVGGESFQANGLYLVYQENILRFFKPFDHQDPIYVYFFYLPLYLLPWSIFFIPALFALKSRWKTLSPDLKWNACTLAALFLFLTLSGSRRNYYVLPLVPFAILLTAEWILSDASVMARKRLWSAGLVVVSFVFLYFMLDLIPEWYYARFGVARFTQALKADAGQIKPWNEWKVFTLDAESKLNFYLSLPPTAGNVHVRGEDRFTHVPTEAELISMWPILKRQPNDVILVTRKLYAPMLRNILRDYREFEISYPNMNLSKEFALNIPVAYIPTKNIR